MTTKNECFVVIYSPSCCPRPVGVSFFCWAQKNLLCATNFVMKGILQWSSEWRANSSTAVDGVDVCERLQYISCASIRAGLVL